MNSNSKNSKNSKNLKNLKNQNFIIFLLLIFLLIIIKLVNKFKQIMIKFYKIFCLILSNKLNNKKIYFRRRYFKIDKLQL